MFTNGHMNDINEDSEEEDLDFDMWAGQFEFVGPNDDRFLQFSPNNGIKKPHNDQV